MPKKRHRRGETARRPREGDRRQTIRIRLQGGAPVNGVPVLSSKTEGIKQRAGSCHTGGCHCTLP
eukprot:353273-Chlamydomonas_euryale.AAC.10